MKYDIIKTSKYKKGLKRAIKRNLDISLFDVVVDALADGRRLDDKYDDHLLRGDYEGFRECHTLPDWLLVYAHFDDALVLVLQDTGSHSDLFR